jgi:hypothetical protein
VERSAARGWLLAAGAAVVGVGAAFALLGAPELEPQPSTVAPASPTASGEREVASARPAASRAEAPSAGRSAPAAPRAVARPSLSGLTPEALAQAHWAAILTDTSHEATVELFERAVVGAARRGATLDDAQKVARAVAGVHGGAANVYGARDAGHFSDAEADDQLSELAARADDTLVELLGEEDAASLRAELAGG